MGKISREQTRRHMAALALLDKPRLTDDDREQVFRDYHPGFSHRRALDGAYFTPFGLAGDFALELNGARRILDLCAGIGVLSAFAHWRSQWDGARAAPIEITCVEINPDYVEVGKMVAPWARWIEADAFDLTPDEIGTFDIVIGNPPFGRAERSAQGPRYRGRETELHLIDHAARFAPRGAFIVPTSSAPFRYSGAQCFARMETGRGVEFERQTGITLDVGAGVDCSIYRDQWGDVAPSVEIVCAEFEGAKPVQAALDLFGEVA